MTPALDNEITEQPTRLDDDEYSALTVDELADLIEKDPAAIAELRRLILEGLESIEDAHEEADDEWLESLFEGVRQRAAARSAERK